jgi:two-component system sensor histidine kinase/response regulator
MASGDRTAEEMKAGATRFSELFASMVNHELRNALNAVSTAASLLEMRADSEKIATPVERIALSAARMERMLSQLVDFTRIELDGALVLIREPFELAEVVESLIAELPEGLRERVAFEHDEDTEGRWDRDRVTRSLSTLISNALQHGTRDGKVSVTIRGDLSNDHILVTVDNEGEIASEVVEQLFVPKRHVAQKGQAPSGLGLGLYVAQNVAHAHGGELEVRSAQGRTRFTLRLPVQPTPSIRPSKPTDKHA